MAELQFGRVQMKIMRILWKKSRATARDITEALNKEMLIAHSTVQTLLRELEKKGAIDHDINDRTFIFFPCVENEKVTKKALRDFIDHIFAGSPGKLVSYLVQNEKIPPRELEKIREMIDQQEK